jgi:hypothetical protein
MRAAGEKELDMTSRATRRGRIQAVVSESFDENAI